MHFPPSSFLFFIFIHPTCHEIYNFFPGRGHDKIQQAPRRPQAGQDPRPGAEEAEAPDGGEHVLVHRGRAGSVQGHPMQRFLGQEAGGAGEDGAHVQGPGGAHKEGEIVTKPFDESIERYCTVYVHWRSVLL